MLASMVQDDVIKWKHFPRYWPFVRGIHRSPVNSPHKGQWRGALMFSLICVWINDWVNNREAGDLSCYRAHYDVTNAFVHQWTSVVMDSTSGNGVLPVWCQAITSINDYKLLNGSLGTNLIYESKYKKCLMKNIWIKILKMSHKNAIIRGLMVYHIHQLSVLWFSTYCCKGQALSSAVFRILL